MLSRKTPVIFFALCALWHSSAAQSSGSQGADALDRQVQALLAGMSLKDKVGEMTQLSIDMLCEGEPYQLQEPITLNEEKMRKALVEHRVGSILNAPGHTLPLERWREIIGAIQQMAMEEKPGGIPVLYGIDAIHGANYVQGATLFPQQIALAATWDTALVADLAAMAAYETRAAGIPWNFSPVLDLGRDARWPRMWETFGEDVLLASRMGEAMVRGYQGQDLRSSGTVAACLKHFLGYSVTLSGRDRTPAWVPERELRELFLPPFQAAIEAGARTIMINSGEMNGIPVHTDRYILTDLLRGELGFTGVAVTDWEDIKYLYTRHRVAADYKEAIEQAIMAGIDMSMVPMDLEFPVLLAELVREGRIPMSRIDEAVGRILRLKLELGLWDAPLGPQHDPSRFGSPAHARLSYAAAAEAVTLLRNRGAVLPLSDQQRILVTGPTAHSLNALNGGWTHTWQGVDTTWNTPGKPTLLRALQAALPGKISYVPGSSISEVLDLNAVEQAAAQADVVLVCLGEMPYTEKPGDLSDLALPQAQLELLQVAKASGKPVVLVLIQGRPRTLGALAELPDAVLMGYLPGDEGGRALTDVILGRVNPGGRLPFTYPRHPNALLTYDHKKTEQLHTDFSWDAFNPLFRFGSGLSYTEFAYSNPEISQTVWDGEGELTLSITLSNTGRREGSDVVLCMLDDEVASITPPVQRLVAFEKVRLAPGQSQRVSFSLTRDDLAFIGRDRKAVVEPGTFRVTLGDATFHFELRDNGKP